MTHIELPRALEAYFAYAETEPTRNGRRFAISLPYFEASRLDRLQWWYHLSREQEQRFGETIVATLREQATERFRKHIEQWLQNTGRRIYGDEPIPQIGPLQVAVAAPAPTSAAPAPAETAATVSPWPAEKVANG
jgi:hypothetical protein